MSTHNVCFYGEIKKKSLNFHQIPSLFSAIFTGADKSYLTYPYPTRGIDKKRTTTCVVNTLVV